MSHPAVIEENSRREALVVPHLPIIMPRCLISLTADELARFGSVPRPPRVPVNDPVRIAQEQWIRQSLAMEKEADAREYQRWVSTMEDLGVQTPVMACITYEITEGRRLFDIQYQTESMKQYTNIPDNDEWDKTDSEYGTHTNVETDHSYLGRALTKLDSLKSNQLNRTTIAELIADLIKPDPSYQKGWWLSDRELELVRLSL